MKSTQHFLKYLNTKWRSAGIFPIPTRSLVRLLTRMDSLYKENLRLKSELGLPLTKHENQYILELLAK